MEPIQFSRWCSLAETTDAGVNDLLHQNRRALLRDAQSMRTPPDVLRRALLAAWEAGIEDTLASSVSTR